MIIQRIESRIDFISKTTDLYKWQYFSKENEDCSLQYSHIIRNVLQMKKPFELAYGFKSNCTYINKRFTSWKIVFSLDQIFIERYFHHFAMNSYLHKKRFPWQVSLSFIHWNRRISAMMILYISCQVVWCLMTSSWIYWRKRNWNDTTKNIIIFLQILRTTTFICTGGHFKTSTGKKAHRSV